MRPSEISPLRERPGFMRLKTPQATCGVRLLKHRTPRADSLALIAMQYSNVASSYCYCAALLLW